MSASTSENSVKMDEGIPDRAQDILDFIRARFPSVRESPRHTSEQVLDLEHSKQLCYHYWYVELQKCLRSGLLTPMGEPYKPVGGPVLHEMDMYSIFLNDEDLKSLKVFIEEKYGKQESSLPNLHMEDDSSKSAPMKPVPKKPTGPLVLRTPNRLAANQYCKTKVMSQRLLELSTPAPTQTRSSARHADPDGGSTSTPAQPGHKPRGGSRLTKLEPSSKQLLRRELKLMEMEDREPQSCDLVRVAYEEYRKASEEHLQSLRIRDSRRLKTLLSAPKLPSRVTKDTTFPPVSFSRCPKRADQLLQPKPPPPRDNNKPPLVAEHRRRVTQRQELLRNKVAMKVTAARLEKQTTL